MRMTAHLAALCLMLGALTTLPAQASDTPANPLYEQASLAREQNLAPHFQIGNTTYQVVPGAVIAERNDQAASDTDTARRTTQGAASETVVATLGPYAISLPEPDGSSRRTTARSATIDGVQQAVVVNLRTGRPALLLAQLELHTRSSGQGESLAQTLGASLVFDGAASRVVILQFADVADALRALPQASALDGVASAQPVMRRAFRQRH